MQIIEFIDGTIKKNMYADIKKMISEDIAIPCVISLFAYSEVIGALNRIIAGESENVVFGAGQSNLNYEAYFSLAGKSYKKLDPRTVYRLFRGGLIHRYFPERQLTIILDNDDPAGLHDYGSGCPISINDNSLGINVNHYFHDVKQVVNKIRKRSKRQNKEELELYRSRSGICVTRH